MKTSNETSGVPRPRGRLPEVPVAKSITKQNIEMAYASDKGRYQRRRIRTFGDINREVLRQLGAEIRPERYNPRRTRQSR